MKRNFNNIHGTTIVIGNGNKVTGNNATTIIEGNNNIVNNHNAYTHVKGHDKVMNNSRHKTGNFKQVDATNIKELNIMSPVAVEITASPGTNEVTAIYYGNHDFNLVEDNGTVALIFNLENDSRSGYLELQIPNTILEKLVVFCFNDVCIDDSVSAQKIDINAISGDIEVRAFFKKLTAKCSNGDVDVETTARTNIELDIGCKNGDVDIEIEDCRYRVKTDCSNDVSIDQPGGQYIVSGKVAVMNGDLDLY